MVLFARLASFFIRTIIKQEVQSALTSCVLNPSNCGFDVQCNGGACGKIDRIKVYRSYDVRYISDPAFDNMPIPQSVLEGNNRTIFGYQGDYRDLANVQGNESRIWVFWFNPVAPSATVWSDGIVSQFVSQLQDSHRQQFGNELFLEYAAPGFIVNFYNNSKHSFFVDPTISLSNLLNHANFALVTFSSASIYNVCYSLMLVVVIFIVA